MLGPASELPEVQAEVGVRQRGSGSVRREDWVVTDCQTEQRTHVFCEWPSQWLKNRSEIRENQSPKDAEGQPAQEGSSCSFGPSGRPWGPLGVGTSKTTDPPF